MKSNIPFILLLIIPFLQSASFVAHQDYNQKEEIKQDTFLHIGNAIAMADDSLNTFVTIKLEMSDLLTLMVKQIESGQDNTFVINDQVWTIKYQKRDKKKGLSTKYFFNNLAFNNVKDTRDYLKSWLIERLQ